MVEALLFPLGVLFGIAAAVLSAKAENLYRRFSVRRTAKRDAAHEKRLLQQGWRAPAMTGTGSYLNGWSWYPEVPDHAEVGRNRFGF